MTYFEKNYLLNRPSKIAISYKDDSKNNNGAYDLTSHLQKQKYEFINHIKYRELDQLLIKLKKEIKAIKTLRMEMEK